jgi:hypothetical protein
MDNVIFISYSHQDQPYRAELEPALAAVGSIRDRVWVDQKKLDSGDQFHPAIQQALAGTRVALLLISNAFLTSEYITQHELPYLLDQAEHGAVKLGMLYVSSVAKAALSVTLERDGQSRRVNLADTLGVNSPAEPLDLMKDRGERNAIYARAADWVARQLIPPSPRPQALTTGPRHELAILIQARRDHWQHQFFLPTQPDAIKPKLDYPKPTSEFDYDLDGETLFALLFGRDPLTWGQLLTLAFDADHRVDPTEAPLRIRLLTDVQLLRGLPWGSIAYRGHPLYQDGWTVELHAGVALGFPEYSRHLCYFPSRVVLVGSAASRQTAHFRDDLPRFFQQHWPENPDPVVVADAVNLRAALQAGSTRLVYYYGPASRHGLLLQDGATDGGCVSWKELAEWLRQSQSVSVLFLNLVGETEYKALAQGEVLLDGVKGAVLFQCNPRTNAHAAAKAGLTWLDKVFCRRLDPIVALHQPPCGHISAWTRYSSWQTVVPARLQNPDMVNLLLDRHRQRDTLSGARDEFYTYATRYIHHVVALGTPGCLTSHFPEMIKQHLVRNQREREAYYYRAIDLTAGTDNVQRVDDAVRRQCYLSPSQALLSGLLDPDLTTGMAFCFLVLGWRACQAPVSEAMLRAVADWCRHRLGAEFGAAGQSEKVRVISILALEAEHAREELAPVVERLIDEYDTEPGFHFGELDPLAAVGRQDLRKYFRNETICSCDDRYREQFPDLLLAKRQEMPFDEAVVTIRRGEPDNWGNLFDELTDMTEKGAWPPPHHDPKFWST